MTFANSVSKTVKCCLFTVNFFIVFCSNHMFEGQPMQVRVSYKDKCLTWTEITHIFPLACVQFLDY